MNRYAIAALLAALAAPASAADVAVSISIGQPGYYGPVDVVGYPPPRLVYAQPVVIEPVPVAQPPIYLRVRPGDEKKWKKQCRKYDACGRPVYFVSDAWYNDVYVKGHGKDKKDKKGKGHPKD